jgi:hypothetical protein
MLEGVLFYPCFKKIVAKVTPSAVVSCSHKIDAQVIWNLVHSSWILQINYNKQRVALIAALLSSFCHLFYILCYLMVRACIKETLMPPEQEASLI